MAKLRITAKIFTDEGGPAINHRVVVQAFLMRTGRWNKLLQASTDNKGQLKIDSANNRGFDGNFAPVLRLVEEGNPAPRILATGGAVQFVQNQNLLRVDFGHIERLDETAYKRIAAGVSAAETVAGVPRRKDVSIVAMNRMVFANAGLSAALSAPRAEVAASSVSATATNAALSSDIQVAFLINKEVQTLKAREKVLSSQILDQAREKVLQVEQLEKAQFEMQILQQSLGVAQADVAVARKTSETLSEAMSAVTTIDTIFSSVGNTLKNVNATMKEEDVPYRVAGIKLDLRGSLINGGQSLIANGVIGPEGKPTGGNSSIQAEILPVSASSEEAKVTIPDVTGLTESACRRVLTSLGLRLKKATQTVKSGTGTPGQVIRQHPEANSQLHREEEVLVVFGVAPIEST